MDFKLIDSLQTVYETAVQSVQADEPRELRPSDFRALIRFFVLVNMNNTLEACGIFPRTPPPKELVNELENALLTLSESLKRANDHKRERKSIDDNDVN